MMRWTLLVFWLIGSVAQAQQGRVQSGEHPGFTRLSLPLAKDIGWTIGRTTDGYKLRIDAPVSLDISEVYRWIGQDRVAEIGADNDGLTLSLSPGCNCHARAFRFRNRFLVIDVLDGPAALGGRNDAALDETSVRPSLAAPGRMMLSLAPGTPPVPVADFGIRAITERQTATPVTRTDPVPDMTGFERSVVDSLARAASQGLLDLVPDMAVDALSDKTFQATEIPPQKRPQMSSASTSLPTAPPQATSDHIATATPGTPGLLAHTSLDSLQSALEATGGTAGQTDVCWPADFTDLETDADKRVDFGEEIGSRLAVVTDDGDRADSAAVAALAKGYLSFGFGQEAIQSLTIDGVNDRSRVALRAMAEVIDGLPQSTSDLARQIECPGATALWAVLASGRPEVAAKADTDQIVQHFKLLPTPLQTALAARLANLLRLGGRPDMASLVLAPAQRMDAPPAEVVLAETEVVLERGDIVTATATLAEMVQENPRMTPEAVVQLVDLQISQDEPVAPETLALLESMQFEFRGQPVVTDLKRAQLATLIQAGDFAAALQLLPETEAVLHEEASFDLRSDLTRAVAAKAEDLMFLDIAFRPLGRDVAPDVQNAVATRLLDLGFPERAVEVMGGPAIGSVMAERRYLRALAAIQMGDRASATAQLAGVTTPRALGILGIDSARGATQSAEDNDAAWRSGDWTALATSEDTLLQEAAALAQDQVSAVPDTKTPLASGRALIEDATRTRATIDTLMSRFTPPS